MLKCERVESERARAMMASKYLYLFMEVLLLDKHPCLAQSYMLDEQGHVFVVDEQAQVKAHIIRCENSTEEGQLVLLRFLSTKTSNHGMDKTLFRIIWRTKQSF